MVKRPSTKMECPICFEPIAHAYKMKGCSHKVCRACSRTLQEQPESVHFAFSAIYVIEAAPQIQLKCPMCRAVEPVKTAEELKDKFPDEYLDWMESELHRDEGDNTFSYVYENDYQMPVAKQKQPKIPKLVNNRKVTKRWQGRKM